MKLPPSPLPRKWRESGATNAAPCVQASSHTLPVVFYFACIAILPLVSPDGVLFPLWRHRTTISSAKSVKLKEVVKLDRPVMA